MYAVLTSVLSSECFFRITSFILKSNFRLDLCHTVSNQYIYVCRSYIYIYIEPKTTRIVWITVWRISGRHATSSIALRFVQRFDNHTFAKNIAS